MKPFKLLSRLFAAFGLVMMFSVSGWGIILDTDTFNVDKEGWGGSGESWDAGSQRLFINRDQTGTKTFTFAAYPNQVVTVTLNATKTATWEVADVISITANGVEKHNLNTDGLISFDTTLNGSGQLFLVVMPNTSANDEDLYIDNVTINYNLLPPVLTDATKTITENSASGTNVGTALTATNSPTGYTITGGTGQALFDISAAGQITVKSGAVLDYETTPSYTLLVKATNAAGDSNIATITINLTDVLVPLVTAGQSFSLLTGTANGTVVGTVATTVATPTDFNITGNVFAINSSGQITVLDNTQSVVGTQTYTVGASTSEGGDSKPITITVTQRYSDLELANTDSKDPVITNEQYSYTVGVYNAGPDEATDVVLVDTLPVGVTFVSAVGTGWNCNESGGYVTCTRPNLTTVHANSNVVITVLAPVIGGTITNSATVTSSGIDLNPVTNTNVEQSTTVQAKADLRIVKTGPASAIVNNTIQYTLSVTNLGPSATDNVTVTDVLPVGIGFQITSGNDWICSFTTATRTLSCIHPTTLEVGATSAITLVTTAPATVPSPAGVTNTATVTGPLVDDVSGNNTSSVTTTITAASYTTPNVRPFALFRQDNFNGDIQMIGNSVMLVSGTPATCALAGQVNNNLNTVYADRDSDTNTTLNSTSADLVLPPKVRSGDIQYAMLYWQGRTKQTSTQGDNISKGKTVKIKPFGMASYQTLTSLDTKFNWTGNDYQGAVEVTNLIKNSLDAVGTATLDATGYNKPLWVGDVFANQLGSNSNGFGAWSLIIAYKDSAAKLRNLSTYDGYDVVASGSPRSATLSGFLTPSSGAVDSKFLVFAGEGDSNYVSDQATLTNKAGTPISVGANTFKSVEDINGVNVTNRNPNCANTIGLDLRTFSVGSTGPIPIIENGQTTTTVAMSSSQDQYFPGAFAFSTELYTPNVCYNESVTYNNLPVSGLNIPVSGNKVEYTVTIKNADAEDAKGVFVEKVFDKSTQLSYAKGSMQVAPISSVTYSVKTDKIGDDTAEFGNSTAKFLLGTGAAWYQGGTILQNQETNFKYKAVVGTETVDENVYKLSYRNDLLHLTFNGISAPKCTDFNNSFTVTIPPIPVGVYDAWETDIAGAPPAQEDRKIRTKIANKPFTLTVGAMNGTNDAYQPYTDGFIGWRLVESATCPNGDNNATGWYDINLSTAINQITHTVTTANQDLQIQFARKDINGTYALINANCSSDNFAIRPERFTSTLTANQVLTAGLAVPLTFRADDNMSNATVGYNEIENSSFDVEVALSNPIGKNCAQDTLNFTPSLIFTDGTVTNNYQLRNVGDFNVSIRETVGNEFARVDTVDTLEIDRLITPYNQQIIIRPASLDVNATLVNGSLNDFTYLSNFRAYPTAASRNISAQLDLNVTALMQDGNITSNYTNTCYAKDGTIAVTIAPFAMTPANAVNNLIWYENNQAVEGALAIPNTGFNLPIALGAFNTAGVDSQARVRYAINFDRNETRVVDPQQMTVTAVTATDADGITALLPVLNTEVINYIYGRIIPRDVRVFGNANAFTANAWYEVFNAQNIGITRLPGSRNEVNWFTNTLHTAADGDSPLTMLIAPNNAVNANGVQTYNFNPQAIGRYNEHITTVPWLWYGTSALPYLDPNGPAQVGVDNLNCLTHPCFKINVVPDIAATGSAHDESTNQKANKSSATGGGGAWRTINDYSPAVR